MSAGGISNKCRHIARARWSTPRRPPAMPSVSLEATCRSASAPYEGLFFGWFLDACSREFATSVSFALCNALLRSRQASAQAGAKGRPRAEQRSTSLQPWSSVARKQGVRDTCPAEFLATFCAQPASAPGTCRPLGAKRPERHAGGGESPTRWKEIGWHHSSTPHGQGGGLGTFLPGGAASRRASTKTATRLC